MSIEQEREKLILFTKIGAIVLTSFALLATSFFVYPENRAVINESLLHEKELPIYCVEKEKPQISISFDAAWGNDDTASLLATLKKHKVKATFFMTGGWIEKYPDDVKAIAAGGHDLGNHSENHKQMSQLSAAQCKEEIMKPHDKVKKLTGKDMILFRPPYGDYNDTLIRVCRENKYYPIQWDVDSLDWKDYDAATIIRRVTEHKHLGNGSIILCHNGGKHTAISALLQYHSGLFFYMLHQRIQCLANCLNKLKAVQNYRIFTCGNERKTLCHFSIFHSLNACSLQFVRKIHQFRNLIQLAALSECACPRKNSCDGICRSLFTFQMFIIVTLYGSVCSLIFINTAW